MGCGSSRSWLCARRCRREKVSGRCRMCEIIQNPSEVDVFYEDDELFVFRDQFPSAKTHFLIIPKKHIGSVYSLGLQHVGMVKRMEELSCKVICAQTADARSARIGFHVPPFYSVNHLHLHVILPPWTTCYSQFKYPIEGSCFFATPDQVISSIPY